MTPWTLLRSLPRIANTLQDLVRLSQETNLLLRELHRAQDRFNASTPVGRLTTTRLAPLDPDAESRAASQRPPASGDKVWRQTRPMLERQLAQQQDRKLNPHRYPDPATGKSAGAPRPNPDTPTPPTR